MEEVLLFGWLGVGAGGVVAPGLLFLFLFVLFFWGRVPVAPSKYLQLARLRSLAWSGLRVR